MWKTHHLVSADNSHDTSLLHAVLARIKRVPTLGRARVSKHDETVLVRIQVTDSNVVAFDNVLDGRGGDGRCRLVAAAVVLGPSLDAVAVDVHVGKGAA